MTVESLSFSRTTPKIVFSVSGSTFAVDSSKTMIVFRCNSTRAKQINCRFPLHHFLTVRDQVDRRLSTDSFICTSCRTRHKSASVNRSVRSRFFLNEPLNNTGLWPRTDIHRRVSWRLIAFIGMPSMIISPQIQACALELPQKMTFQTPSGQ